MDLAKGDRLAAYCARLGLAVPPSADAAGLAAVVRAQRMAIGFENFDVALGRGIAIDGDAVFAKLVLRPRGGYCFEHNRLLADMLRAIGLTCRPLLARVRLGPTPPGLVPGEEPPRTHVILCVTVAGRPWLADAGFGASWVPPLPLVDGAEVAGDGGEHHRLRRIGACGAEGGEWLVERMVPGAAAWEAVYSFDSAAVAPVDLEQANHWTSTRPGTRFTTLVIASIVVPGGFAALTGRRLTMHHGTRADVMEIASAEDYRQLVQDLFHIALSEAEVAGLGLF